MYKIKWVVYITLFSIGISLSIYSAPTRKVYYIAGEVICKEYAELSTIIAESWLKLQIRNENIVVSLTTTPYRIDKLKPILDGLLSQNISISKIYLNIPFKFNRDNLEYIIPDWLTTYKDVQILRTEDYGPITKLLPVLEQANLSGDTIIITIDDDVKYPNNLVLHLAHNVHKNSNAVAAMSGVNIDYDANGNIGEGYGNGFVKPILAETQISVVEGFAGVAYRRKFFEQDIFEIKEAPQECKNSDDVFISYYLARRHIKRLTVSNEYIDRLKVIPEDYGRGADALHKQALKELDRHRVCIAYLKNKHPNVDF